MQQAELVRVNATYGSDIRAILENFNWDADTHAKLQSAYKEARKNYRCFIERQQVRHVILQLLCRSDLACTPVNWACATPTIQTYARHVLQKHNSWLALQFLKWGIYKTFAMSIQALCLSV